jgi:hypothetical protein
MAMPQAKTDPTTSWRTPMATPLTLYVPIKQDATTQANAEKLYQAFVGLVQKGLDEALIVHYARVALVPNTTGAGYLGLLVITTFDGAMNPYLKFFWDSGGIQKLFAELAAMALNPPNPPVTNLTGFENFINNNNVNKPQDLYQAYPQTVRQIVAKFPHPA